MKNITISRPLESEAFTIKMDQIIFFESVGVNTKINLKNKSKLLYEKAIHQIEKELKNSNFIRVNKDVIINIDYINLLDFKNYLNLPNLTIY